MWNTLVEYLQYPFVRRILVAGVLVAFCASMLGVTLVLKRFSYIGDGLSHVAFAAMAIAMVLRMTNNTLIILPITVVAAILMLKTGQNAKINGDADAFRWIAGIWISDHECIRNIAECIRGCVLDTVWRGIHTHIIEYRCVDLPDYVAVGTCVLHLVLSQDLLGDI